MLLFGRFAQTAQYSTIEGQPGAAAAVLQSMRGNWTVTPAIAANRNMDVVHRAVGRPGVVLVGEGSPTRLPSLLAAEKKRVARVAFDVPIHDYQVGDGQGQIPLRKLQRKIMKLPRDLKGTEVADLNFRLKALPQTLQAPKGPMPRGGRQPKMPRPARPLSGQPACRRGSAAGNAAPDHAGVSRRPVRGRPGHTRRRQVMPADDGVGRFVVQAAPVTVDDQRRHHAEQQHRPDQAPADADRPAVQPGHPHAECPLADRGPGQHGQYPDLRGEESQRPVLRMEQRGRDEDAQKPVDEQGANRRPIPDTERGPAFG